METKKPTTSADLRYNVADNAVTESRPEPPVIPVLNESEITNEDIPTGQEEFKITNEQIEQCT